MMVTLTGKVIKLLLISIMVAQQLMASYAMASMDHSQPKALSDITQSHDRHSLHQEMSMTESQDAAAINDCCNSAACCPATVSVTDVMVLASNTHFFISPYTFRNGVELPAEVKPPRPLFG